MPKHAIFLGGPIGAGKTTLGQALAQTLGGGFVDGDDHADPGRPWYGSIRRTSAAIVRAGMDVVETRPCVVIAYPLGCTTWIYFRRKFGDAGVQPLFVSLRASYDHIVSAARGRRFSDEERARIKVMLREGYAERPFSDLIIDTDKGSFDQTARQLEADIRRLLGSVKPSCGSCVRHKLAGEQQASSHHRRE